MKESVEISKLNEGMEVAEPVMNNFGQTLIPKGIQITARHINILKTWQISTIVIKTGEDKGNEIGVDDVISDELRASAELLLKKRLNWIPENQYEQAIYDMALIATVKGIRA